MQSWSRCRGRVVACPALYFAKYKTRARQNSRKSTRPTEQFHGLTGDGDVDDIAANLDGGELDPEDPVAGVHHLVRDMTLLRT